MDSAELINIQELPKFEPVCMQVSVVRTGLGVVC